MDNSESKVIRIVNLDKNTTNQALKVLLKEQLHLQGEIEKTYVRQDNKLSLVFAYVIFEFSCDAKRAREELNGLQYQSLQLDVAVIAPNSGYKEYIPATGKLQESPLFKGYNIFSTWKGSHNKKENSTINRSINRQYQNPLNSLALCNPLAKKNMNSLDNLDSNYKNYESGEKATNISKTPPIQSVKSKIRNTSVYDRHTSASAIISTSSKPYPNNTVKRSVIGNKNKISKLNQERDGNTKKTAPKLATKSENTIKNVLGGNSKSNLNQQGRGGSAKRTTPKLATKLENTLKNISSERNSKSNLNQERTTPKVATKSENTIKNFLGKNLSTAEGNAKSNLNQGRGGNAKNITSKLATKSENTIKNIPDKNKSTTEETTKSKSNAKTDNGLKTNRSIKKPSTQSKELLSTNTNENKYKYWKLSRRFNTKMNQENTPKEE